ncbi:MAG: spinster family MFS transporter [Candidatus Methylomirabilales bacterium]
MQRWGLLTLLCAINLLNYVDRYLPFAVFPQLQTAFSLSDTRLGLLGSAFMIMYLLAAPVFAPLGDRWRRGRLVALGVALWSAATVGTGLARSYGQLFAARALVGIGEASFGTVGPTLIADAFPPERRGMMLSLFYMAIPVGSAIGYLIGGLVGEAWGWRAAFYVAGPPGLLLAAAAWGLREPARPAWSRPPAPPPRTRAAFRTLLHNRSYLLNTAAMTAMTFALGGLAAWLPTYFIRVHGFSLGTANLAIGAITVVAGLGGTLLGGWGGDRLLQRTRKAYFLVSGWGLLISAPAAVLAIAATDPWLAFGAIFVAEVLVFLNTGPLNALIVAVTPPGIRARAFGLNIFAIHAFGDALSPALLGLVSDLTDLSTALTLPAAFLAAAGLLCLWGARGLPADMAAAAPEESARPTAGL